MVRFINAVVTIYTETATENDEGDIIAGYSATETIEGDVQPANLTQDEMKLYGISTIKGGVKKFFYNGFHENVKAGNRASVLSAFTGKTELYNIMPVNCWSVHGVVLLVPVENEAEIQSETGTEQTSQTEGNNGE